MTRISSNQTTTNKTIHCFIAWILLGVIEVSAASLTPMDFWFYEHLENQKLRQSSIQSYFQPVLQLNTRPFTPHVSSSTAQEGWILEQASAEYGVSTEMPHVQARSGAWMSKGNNLILNARMGWTSETISFWAEPQVRWHENQNLKYTDSAAQPVTQSFRAPQESGSFSKAELHRAFLLLTWKNLLVQAGKDNLRFGTGKRGTLHLSNNTEPYPLIRVGTRQPWDTSSGYWSFLHYIAQLESNRAVPDARLSGWRLDWSTQRRVELGISRSWMVGFDPADNNLQKTGVDLYTTFFKPSGDESSINDHKNQQIVFDFRLKFPEIKTVFYGEWGREDHQHDLGGARAYWDSTQGHILGVKQIDLFGGQWFWIFEKANNAQPSRYPANAPWYNHSEYKSGWSYKGIGLGHPMGSDSIDQFFALGQESLAQSWMLYLGRQTHGIRTIPAQRQEVKNEIGVNGAWEFAEAWKLHYQILSESYTNFALVEGQSLESKMLISKLTYRF